MEAAKQVQVAITLQAFNPQIDSHDSAFCSIRMDASSVSLSMALFPTGFTLLGQYPQVPNVVVLRTAVLITSCEHLTIYGLGYKELPFLPHPCVGH